VDYAQAKLVNMNLNMVVENSTEVFGNDNSSVKILSKHQTKQYNNKSK
ncbi:bifunctional phosphopantothenoylcysteine decarboxylase/phosphopantothenate--cysteine ligase CoaBC, partial [Francisella tularensis subsp. holarctica]|nr:bifunctional phosphopantothenoylcysteine decarboxylase/phosphopantothenate--cysteine ligase CoaBC [Francisella tularensis subsp. holarctica]